MAAEFPLERYAWISVAAALVTIVLKTAAWHVTGSVGLLSDALEALINIAAALLTLSMLRLAAVPPDEAHPYGRFKAEYFSSGIEGALIVFAAVSIAYAAVPRLGAPQPIEAPLLGIALSVAATAVNLGVGLLLIREGRRRQSIAIEADGHDNDGDAKQRQNKPVETEFFHGDFCLTPRPLDGITQTSTSASKGLVVMF